MYDKWDVPKQYLWKNWNVKESIYIERDITEYVHIIQMTKDLLHGVNGFMRVR